VNFTREPIIETIISPKEGYKLLVRNSKGENFEEYYVDAVEVVSFGRAFFFRSQERPKAFLVPVSDYEILEVKEARVALKNASHEKSIKIGGGREAHMRPQQREPREAPSPAPEEAPAAAEETALETAVESRMDRKRDRRRHRRRRGGHEDRGDMEQKAPEHRAERESEAREFSEEEGKGPSLFSSLIPPPPTLISETLSRYREKEVVEPKEHETQEEPTSEAPPEPRERDDEEPGADSQPLHRISAKEDVVEVTSFNSTYFIPLSGGNDPFF
jgi:hypothetical protein